MKLTKTDEAFRGEVCFYTDSKLQRKSVSKLLTHSADASNQRPLNRGRVMVTDKWICKWLKSTSKTMSIGRGMTMRLKSLFSGENENLVQLTVIHNEPVGFFPLGNHNWRCQNFPASSSPLQRYQFA